MGRWQLCCAPSFECYIVDETSFVVFFVSSLLLASRVARSTNILMDSLRAPNARAVSKLIIVSLRSVIRNVFRRIRWGDGIRCLMIYVRIAVIVSS